MDADCERRRMVSFCSSVGDAGCFGYTIATGCGPGMNSGGGTEAVVDECAGGDCGEDVLDGGREEDDEDSKEAVEGEGDVFPVDAVGDSTEGGARISEEGRALREGEEDEGVEDCVAGLCSRRIRAMPAACD